MGSVAAVGGRLPIRQGRVVTPCVYRVFIASVDHAPDSTPLPRPAGKARKKGRAKQIRRHSPSWPPDPL